VGGAWMVAFVFQARVMVPSNQVHAFLTPPRMVLSLIGFTTKQVNVALTIR
jgi:hypothetical protein